MNIRLHKNARTTPAIRREIQAATGSDYELAERFGVTRQTIVAIEQGRYSPSLEVAFRIARAFGAPLEQVFQYEGDGN